MTRRLVWFGLAYALGLMVCANVSQPLFVIFPPVLAAVWLLCRRQKPDRRVWVCATAYCCGCLLWLCHTALVVQPLQRLNGQTLTFSGVVRAVDCYENDTARYLLSATLDGRPARLLCYGDAHGCAYGDTLTLTATLSVPTDSYLFPAARYNAGRGVYLTASELTIHTVTPDTGFSLPRAVQSFRADTIAQIRRTIPAEEAGLLTAMLCGECAGLDDAAETALFRTGIGHITSVSGLHLSLLCACAARLLRKIRCGRRAQLAVLTVLIGVFALFADTSGSVLRAGVMLLLVYGSGPAHRTADPLNSLCAAFVLLTLPAPYLANSASFLLSFSATFAIAVLAPWLTAGIRRNWLRTPAVMACVSVAVLPVSVLYFQETATIAPLANLMLVPLCMAALVCGLLLLVFGGFPLPAELLLQTAAVLCRTVLSTAELLARLPFSHLPLGYTAYRLLLPALAVLVGVVFFHTRRRRATAIAFVTAALVFLNSALILPLAERNTLRLAVLGDGQSRVLVLAKGGTAAIFSLHGADDVDYARHYLLDVGISRVALLYCAAQPLSALPAYDEALGCVTVAEVLVPAEAPLTQGLSVGGCPVRQVDTLACTLFDATVHMDADVLTLQADGKTICFALSDTAEPPACDLLIPHDAAVGISPNTELRISSGASFVARRLAE